MQALHELTGRTQTTVQREVTGADGYKGEVHDWKAVGGLCARYE